MGSNNVIVKVMSRGRHILRVGKRLLISPTFRAQWLMEKGEKDRVQQTTQRTWEDRYPEIFTACKEYFDGQGKENIKILSFGCCTGEEVVTLRRYFPKAEIVGAELNKHSLKICKDRKMDEKVHFIYSDPKLIEEYGPYDAVFCMAVLERYPDLVKKNEILDIKDMYPFEKFDKQLHEIDSYVKDGGMLTIHFTHYDITDTDLAEKYSSYGEHGFVGMIFGKDSKIKKNKLFHQSMYIKQKAM